MLLKLPEVIIEKNTPFSNCKLDREQYARVLTDIAKLNKDGFVLAINNPWGTGKTTFVKMWNQLLINQGFKTLYFNAWENDSENDIFITLISELTELKEKKNEQAFKNVLDKATPLAKSLAQGIIQTLMEKHIGKEFTKQAISILGDSITTSLEEKINLYLERKNDIFDFKQSLEAYVSETSEELPVVFIIDELDRCRPDYAVEFLEHIKHLFSVTGIVFALSIDKTQLGNAIKGFYGSEQIDSTEYLRRFIDVEYSLPDPNTESFCTYLYNTFGFDEFLESQYRSQNSEFKNDPRNLIYFSAVLFEGNNLALRVQEKIFAHARIALMTFENNQYLLPTLYILLIFIRTCYYDIYQKIEKHKYNLQELVQNVESILPKEFSGSKSRIVVNAVASLLVSYNNSDHLNKEEIISLNEDGLTYNLNISSRFENIPEANFLKRILERHLQTVELLEIDTEYLLHRIELTDSIKITPS